MLRALLEEDTEYAVRSVAGVRVLDPGVTTATALSVTTPLPRSAVVPGLLLPWSPPLLSTATVALCRTVACSFRDRLVALVGTLSVSTPAAQ